MRITTAILVSLAVVSIASADLKSQINAMNSKVTKAFEKKDFAAVDKILKATCTSDFKYIDAGRTMDYKQMFDGLKMGLSGFTKIESAIATSKNVKISGSSATAETTHVIVATMLTPDKKTHKMEMSGDSHDVYRKEGKTWKMAAMTWGSSKMTMDGKPMDMSKMAPPKTR